MTAFLNGAPPIARCAPEVGYFATTESSARAPRRRLRLRRRPSKRDLLLRSDTDSAVEARPAFGGATRLRAGAFSGAARTEFALDLFEGPILRLGHANGEVDQRSDAETGIQPEGALARDRRRQREEERGD